MEESGHYYTAYFTSLAVGFDKNIAYKHALLAQMPDQIGFLDATDLHAYDCFSAKLSKSDFPEGQVADVNEWRYLIEFVLHSLIDKTRPNISSATQRANTRRLLLNSRPDSLEFGLLLHRLGDTYAHSVIDREESMYTVSRLNTLAECTRPNSLGHLRDWHDPDYPFRRLALFDKYITDLYDILYKKVSSSKAIFRRSNKPMPVAILKSTFSNILRVAYRINPNWFAGSRNLGIHKLIQLSNKERQLFIIQQIREQCRQRLGITMDSYSPETMEKQTLSQFLNDHPELKGLNIEYKLKAAIGNLNNRLIETPMIR